jgi:hypothetical protein
LRGSYSKESGRYVDLTNSEGKRGKQLIVARLMLTTFVRPPTEGELARHLDDNKHNQVIENLAWGNGKDNAADADRNNRLRRGSSHGMSRLNETQVREIKRDYVFRSREFGSYALARKYGVDVGSIWRIVRRNGWKHVV